MDSYQRGGVEMFVNVTGASEAEATRKLQDFRGDLNAAIDSYLSEREASVVPVRINGARTPFVAEDVPPFMDQIITQTFRPMPYGPSWSHRFPVAGSFGFEGMIASRFPQRGGSPFVSQPRDVREIPIDWKDEEPKNQSNADVIIEEIPATDETWPSSQVQPRIVCEDEDTPGPSPMTSAFDPIVGDIKHGSKRYKDHETENHEAEDAMLKAALEASQKQMKDMGILETLRGDRVHENQLNGEDDDFLRAISQSLKTAEQEQALREGKVFSQVTDFSNNRGDDIEEEMLKIALEASQKETTCRSFSETSMGARKLGNQSDPDDDDFMQAVSLSLKTAEQEGALREREESLGLTEGSNFQRGTKNDENSRRKASPISRDIHETCHWDPIIGAWSESKNATGMAKNSTERDGSCMRKYKEQGKQKSAERSTVGHEEPEVENENGVTIMLRLPDGARQGRRFLKSEPLQRLFDFIDTTCGLLHGSYQLVRPYPRRVFAETECASSFQELGLSSKYETLFLEVN